MGIHYCALPSIELPYLVLRLSLASGVKLPNFLDHDIIGGSSVVAVSCRL